MQKDIAWAAGLFEGEGSIAHYVDPLGWTRRRLHLSTTDRDVVFNFLDTVGVGKVYGPRKRGRNKPIYEWHCTKWDDIKMMLTEFLPYMGKRRQTTIHRLLADPPLEHWNRRKTHCKHGHEFIPENTYREPGKNKRQCRTCRQIAVSAYNERQRQLRLS